MRIERKAGDSAGRVGDTHERVVQVVARRIVGRDERDANAMQAGFDRNPRAREGVTPIGDFLVPVEQLHALAVHADLEHLPLDLTEDVLRIADHGNDLEDILSVRRELVLDQDSAPAPEGEPLDVVILGGAVGHLIDSLRRGRRAADRQAADLSRRRQVRLHQRRRHHQRSGHVVEPVGRIVRRQKLRRVDLEPEHVADGIRILSPVQPVQTRCGQVGDCGAIELALEPQDERLAARCIGPRHPRWGHQSSPQLPHHFLRDVRLFTETCEIELVEQQAARSQCLVVAGDAVLIEDRPMRGCRRGGSSGLA